MIMKIILAILSYFVGSIPIGYIVAKKIKGIDIREHGSGNIGATNVLRSIGAGPAIFVFILDILKGLIPVVAAKELIHPTSHLFIMLCGVIAVLGHTLSIFLNFKGGKGVATSLGVIIGLNPLVALLGFGLWTVVLLLSKYVSLASIVAAISVPILMYVFRSPIVYTILTSIIAAYVLIKHHSNIKRLIQGNEAKFGKKINI